MEVREFPQRMARLLSEEENARIAQAREEGHSRQEDLNSRLQKSNQKDEHRMFWLIGGGMVIGMIVGFFACIAQCSKGYYFINAIFICLGTWILCMVAGMLLGALLSVIFSNSRKVKRMETQIHEEDHDYDSRVGQIHEEYRSKREAYERQFMQEAERQKNYLTNSAAVGGLAGSYLQKFGSWIDSADRDPNVGQIQVGTVFRISKEAVQSEAGNFVYAQHGLQELLPVQQAGMAYALRERLTAGLKERYPLDASGGAVRIDSSITMTEENVSLEVVYTADNGHYKGAAPGAGAAVGTAAGSTSGTAAKDGGTDRDTRMWGW